MNTLPPLMVKDRIVDAVLIPVLSVLQAVAMGIGAFATRDVFVALHLGTGADMAVLLTLLAAGAAVASLGWCIKQRAEAIGQSYANALRMTLYRHIAGMNLSALEQRRVGALSLRFVGDLSAARNWFGRGLPLAISACVILPGAAFVLWQLHPLLAVAGFAPLCLIALLTLTLAVGLERRHRALRRKRANLSIAMIERIAVAPLLDLMGRTGKELKNLNATGIALRRNALDRAAQRNGLSGLMDFGASLAGASILLMGVQQGISAGLVAAALAMIAILATPMRELALVWDRFCGWQVAREKALNLLNQQSLNRGVKTRRNPAHVRVDGPATLNLAAGCIHHIHTKDANLLRVIAGLDRQVDMKVTFGKANKTPVISYLGEQPAILQGSLRRAVTLGLRPRPSDGRILAMLEVFEVGHLAKGTAKLKTRMVEAGRNLTPVERFRLELTRIALTKAGLVLIEGASLRTDPNAMSMIQTLHGMRPTTIIIRDDAASDLQADDDGQKSSKTLPL